MFRESLSSITPLLKMVVSVNVRKGRKSDGWARVITTMPPYGWFLNIGLSFIINLLLFFILANFSFALFREREQGREAGRERNINVTEASM